MASASDQPSLGVATAIDEEAQIELVKEVKIATWLKDQVAAEIANIKKNGANALPMTVNNMCIVREGKLIINRVEMDTKFDFSLIQQIMLSDPISCPLKEGYQYVNVLLFTDKPLPLIIPYMFHKDKSNKLTEWLLINSDGKRVRHRVAGFQ